MIRKLLPSLALASLLGSAVQAADTFAVDASHSTAIFRVVHLGVTPNYGRFNDLDGTVTWAGDDLAAAKVELKIKTGSVDTNNGKRDTHLKGPDFFNEKQYPELSFVSKSWAKNADGTYAVSGDLTLKGVTKPTTVTVTKTGEGKDPWGGYRLGFESSFKLNRSEFDIKGVPGGVGEEVTVIIALETIKK